MDTEHEDRLTILERAQLLHDATLRRHGEMLDQHEERIALLTRLLEQQQRTQVELREIAARLETLMAEVFRERHNGREA